MDIKPFVATIAASMLSAAAATAAETPHFHYDGPNGPDNWASLSADYAVCSAGRNQSPVNLSSEIEASLPDLSFDYGSMAKEFVNNGHAVQANYAAGSSLAENYHSHAPYRAHVTYAPGAAMRHGSGSFELKQFHFHSPSEHQWQGENAAAEIHFVHADAQGNLAVVAVPVKSGAENAAIAQLFARLPGEEGQKNAVEGFNAKELLPRTHEYFYYSGSLTTPPCSEGVRWIVMKHAIAMSDAQIEALRKAIGFANNRPVQPLNGRAVLK